MSLTFLSVGYPLAHVGPDAVGGGGSYRLGLGYSRGA